MLLNIFQHTGIISYKYINKQQTIDLVTISLQQQQEEEWKSFIFFIWAL